MENLKNCMFIDNTSMRIINNSLTSLKYTTNNNSLTHLKYTTNNIFIVRCEGGWLRPPIPMHVANKIKY